MSTFFGIMAVVFWTAGVAAFAAMIARVREARRLLDWLWLQPKNRPVLQMLLDLERGEHRRRGGQSQ